MKKLKTLESLTKAEVVGAYRHLLAIAEHEGRELTASEQAVADEYEAEIERRNQHGDSPRGGGLRLASDSQVDVHRPASGFCYRHPRTNEWVRAVSPSESLAAAAGQKSTQGPHFGELVLGCVTGKWENRQAERASISVGQTGSFMVPEITSTNVIDLARARMVMMTAGVRTIPLPAADAFHIGRIETDATADWRREGQHITASEQTFGRISLHPKSVAALIPITREFLEDAQNAADLIQTATVNALAVALDVAILRGSGAEQPTGIKNTADINTTAVGGTWSYDNLVTSMELIWSENGPDNPTAVILSPASEASRRKRKHGDGTYIVSGNTPLAGVPFLQTSSCPDDEIYLGDFSRVLLGVRTDWTTEILPAGTGSTQSGSTFNATTQLGAWLRVYGRFDVHIERPEHLAVLTGVTN